MSNLALRRTCESRLRRLDIPVPVPWRPRELCAELARRRGRPIVIVPMSAARGGAACGIWVATEATDVILVEKATSEQHQDHIIAHELGHMAFDHYGTLDMSAPQLGELMPNLAPALVRRVLGRNAYNAREEQEAEVFASVVMSRSAWDGRRGDGPGDGEVNRFASALEPDGMWRD